MPKIGSRRDNNSAETLRMESPRQNLEKTGEDLHY